MRLPKPPRVYDPKGGRPPKHGPEFRFAKPETWPEPAVTTRTTTNYGKAVTQAWDRVHPQLTHRVEWLDHEGELPLFDGTLIRLKVEHLSKDREAPPVWLWSSKTGGTEADVDRAWQAFLRRFDLEHTFRLFKQTLGWTKPRLREPETADRWTWLIIAAYTQLRLARPLARDLRRPWEKPTTPGRLTPARVRRTFRHLRQHMPCPARAPKPHRPGPGRPPGTRNRSRAPRYDAGKPSDARRHSSPHNGRKVKEQAWWACASPAGRSPRRRLPVVPSGQENGQQRDGSGRDLRARLQRGPARTRLLVRVIIERPTDGQVYLGVVDRAPNDLPQQQTPHAEAAQGPRITDGGRGHDPADASAPGAA